MYSKQVLKHFQNPHNQGKIKNPTVIGTAGSPVCGDTMKLYLKTQKHVLSKAEGSKLKTGEKSPLIPLYERGKDKIEDIKFETLGCAAAIASSSALTDMAKDKTLDEAEKITKEDVVKKLGGLPEEKVHCSLLAVDALKDAIDKLKLKKI
ncbi:MAG: iron-sulfur cluster assembly scaffold protein [bacterium]